ncbi:DUF3906 family protein [Halalkalibacterium ligniniphilum]|uniref:DUF3906 family protein n=1 Tax=Halalkalibacterium ligniniphilum TaxID=1134413 RepID=UPI00034CC939|nr:DUF3906 family protein [Halalkalibacterium ligniniphilum]
MFLYRFEVNSDQGILQVVVVAKDEDTAFQTVEIEVESSYMKLPIIHDITLLEKKPVRKAAAFVLTNVEA